jgi:hypothetical protein
MHTLYTIMVYGALCLWRGGNDSSFGIWTKFAACTAFIFGLFEYERVFYTLFAPFEYLLGYTDPRRPNPNAMHECVPTSASCLVMLCRALSCFAPAYTSTNHMPFLFPQVLLPSRARPIRMDSWYDLWVPPSHVREVAPGN